MTDLSTVFRSTRTTIEELLAGAEIDYPPAKHVDVTFKKAQKVQRKDSEQPLFDFDE